MEPKQRGFWENGGTQVCRPVPSRGPQLHGCLDATKGAGGKQKWVIFYKKEKEKGSESRHENAERKAVKGLGRG